MYSLPLQCKLGVKQGCNLSPLLFNLFINDIHNIFDECSRAVNIDNNKFNSLSFADDLVLLSETEQGLQNCLTTLEKYCSDWGLKVNITKTNVVVFNKSFNKKIKSLNFTIDGLHIEIKNSYCYLGVEISNTGSFTKAIDSMYKKSLRALFSIYAAINVYSDGNTISLFLTLFDSLVKPVLLYGSEVWGNFALDSSKNPLEKFINKFYCTVLGVPKHSSTVGLHVELARFPISIYIKNAMLKYWCRLATLPKTRLAAHCYWSLYKIKNVNDKWLSSVKEIINSSSQQHFNFLWNSQESLCKVNPKTIKRTQVQILETLKNNYLSSAVQTMGEQTKLTYFQESKTEFIISKYLLSTPLRADRSLLCKLRLGVLKLEIETGRHRGLDRNNRHCKVCKSDQIENETHFLFSCVPLKSTRDVYLKQLFEKCPILSSVSHLDKLMYLYFNESICLEELSLANKMLSNLNYARDKILSTTTE